ncbi:MAG: hypothetical protein NZ518_10875 [Dehalococcoidia bacterium]|nr:hypothetical protein [Dehalococcoidia bacterium]
MSGRIDLGEHWVGEELRLRLYAEVEELPERRSLVVKLFAAPPEAAPSALVNDERARYSIWLARYGDSAPVAVDHAQGMSSVAEADGQPYLYWHGRAPGARAFT